MTNPTTTSHLTPTSRPGGHRGVLRKRIPTAAIGALLATAAAVTAPWATAAHASDIEPAAHASGIEFVGNGTTDNPFTSTGCTARTSEGDCIVEFPTRYLGPLQNEMIPAYRCPADEPMLLDRPSNRGDHSPRGVDIVASDLLDTYIHPKATQPVGGGNYHAAGTSTDVMWTATNWNISNRNGNYFTALFCTDNPDRAYLS